MSRSTSLPMSDRSMAIDSRPEERSGSSDCDTFDTSCITVDRVCGEVGVEVVGVGVVGVGRRERRRSCFEEWRGRDVATDVVVDVVVVAMVDDDDDDNDDDDDDDAEVVDVVDRQEEERARAC